MKHVDNQLTAKQARDLANKVYSEKVAQEQDRFLEFCFNSIKETHERGEFQSKIDVESLFKNNLFPQVHKYISVIISTLTDDHFEYKISLTRKNNEVDGLITSMIINF